MRIAYLEIQNFRRLKECHIDLSEETTLFVGANNSGKTSAMDAMNKFLKKRELLPHDFTISNQKEVDKIGIKWIDKDCEKPDSLEEWKNLLPTFDVWIDVKDNELQYVSHIIPTLSWKGGNLGVRFVFQPKDIGKMFEEYGNLYFEARKTEETEIKNLKREDRKIKNTLWPKSLWDFTEQTMKKHFAIKAYILDPEKAKEIHPQKTDYDMECIEPNPLEGFIKIDVISAQRGFSDPETSEGNYNIGNLSSQLRSYYDKHLDPEKTPTPEDITTIVAMEQSKEVINDNLKIKFKSAIAELEQLGYPGMHDPQITIESKIKATDVLRHDSAVQYSIAKGIEDYKLPEKYNGLGYQNLISIIFQLMRFRDDWMQVGKAKKEYEMDRKKIEPLHLVILEEPEAHLHVQVQQVFIKKAYDVLRNHKFLQENKNFATQLVISSHSSYISREMKFKNLRYFRRISVTESNPIPITDVINLSDVFGKEDVTAKFVTRYLKTTHCDLFFADAVIIVEGSAEKMFIPYFIREKYHELNQRYISILEISGSHAHRLRPLIEKLCLNTLIITDIDSVSPEGHHKAVIPQRSNEIITGNSTLKTWVPAKERLDDLMNLRYEEKEISCNEYFRYAVRAAYQVPINIEYKGDKNVEAMSSTFEDSLIYSNINLFENLKEPKDQDVTGTINIIKQHIKSKNNIDELKEAIHQELHKSSFKKAEFSLDFIYTVDPNNIKVPQYIHEGLNWLQGILSRHDEGENNCE